MEAANERLQIGIRVQRDIIYAANPQYDTFVRETENCPLDNELSSMMMWNVFRDWNAILKWKDNDVIGWYYEILNHFRELLERKVLK